MILDEIGVRAESPLALQMRPSSIRDLESLRDLHRFMFEHSQIKGLRYCTWRIPCRRAICPFCAARKARRQFRELGRRVPLTTPGLLCRLSVKSCGDLDRGWIDLAAARNSFGKQSWLTSEADRWVRNTELTLSPQGLWNVHDSILVFGTQLEIAQVESGIAGRWVAAAEGGFLRQPGARNKKLRHPVVATIPAQEVSKVRDDVGARRYSTKGLMKHGKPLGGRTPADLLWDFYHGDAEAAEAWAELESFVSRHPRGEPDPLFRIPELRR